MLRGKTRKKSVVKINFIKYKGFFSSLSYFLGTKLMEVTAMIVCGPASVEAAPTARLQMSWTQEGLRNNF